MPTAQEIYDQQLLQDDPFDYNKAMDEYKGGRKPLLDAIMSNYKKPEPQIDPEQEKKAKYGAALSDTFSSLAQMFAHGQGARVQRKQGASSTEKTNARLQAIRDKYEQDLTQYQTIKGNAAVQDLNMYFANRRKAKDDKLNYAEYLAKQAQDKADRETKAAIDARDFKFKEERAKKEDEYNDRRLKIAASKEEKEDKPKTVPVFVNNKQHQFPTNLVEEVVARAIKDGVAGNVTTGKDNRNRPIVQKVTPTSSLTAQQKQAIFQSVYPRYLQEGDNGQLLIRRGLSDYDKKSGITAQEKFLKPKVQPAATKPTQSNFSLNGVKSR